MDEKSKPLTNSEILILRVENQIKNNQFNSKEQLSKYLIDLKNKGLYQPELSKEKIEQLLNLYDSLNRQDDIPLDMKQYASISLENQDLIVSKENDQVLKTLEDSGALVNEFKQTQNEITANSLDGSVNANTVFEHMLNYKKEEISLISLEETIKKDNIDIEILNKIKFFISNRYINPNTFKVDIASGIFYDTEKDEVYEVRKNTTTNQYEIYKGKELIYGETTAQTSENNLTDSENDFNKAERDNSEEQMVYESRQYQPKVRKLMKPQSTPYDNAAFTKIGFLIINIITFTFLITMIIFLNK